MSRRVHSIAASLISQSRDAALAGVQIFNSLLIAFKSETFLVLMHIAWTYLLHAYYRRNGVEYRYFRQADSRRRFERTRSGLSIGTCPGAWLYTSVLLTTKRRRTCSSSLDFETKSLIT